VASCLSLMYARVRFGVQAMRLSRIWPKSSARLERTTSLAHRLPNDADMRANPRTKDRRTHPYGRTQFEAFRADLERRLRRIYDGDWPQGFDDVITRIARARVRENFGLAPQR
jgi:hypothetical protein